MPEELSDELIEKIRYYVKKYNSKIDAANKLGLSYDMVLFYTKDIKLKSRKKDVDYSGIYGKSLDLLKELIKNGYAFSSGKFGQKEYIKLKKYFPNIRRTKMHGKMIYYLDDNSIPAVKAFVEGLNKKVMSYQELKQVETVFNIRKR
jgi:hypothetical protein